MAEGPSIVITQPAQMPSIAPLLVGLVALVLAVGALAALAGLMLGSRRASAVAIGPTSDPPAPVTSVEPPAIAPGADGPPPHPTGLPAAPLRPGPAPRPHADGVRTLRIVGAGMDAEDEQIARAVVENHLGELRACYVQALAQDPKLGGEIGLMLGLRPNGAVDTLLLGGGEAPATNPIMRGCVTPAVKGWSFAGVKTAHFIYVVGFGNIQN
jgi:hypothetical protein